MKTYYFILLILITFLPQCKTLSAEGVRKRSGIFLAPASSVSRIFLVDSGLGAEQLQMLLEEQVALKGGFKYELLVLGHSIGAKPDGEKILLMKSLIDRAVREFAADSSSIFCVACNTFTFIGAVPYIREATGNKKTVIFNPVYTALGELSAGKDERIGVIGTTSSISRSNSSSYAVLLEKTHGFRDVITYNGQELIDAIQNQVPDQDIIPLVEQAAGIFRRDGIRHLILGCTHYSRIYKLLRRLLPAVRIYDTNTILADKLAQYLLKTGISIPADRSDTSGSLPVYASALNLRLKAA